MGRVSNQPEREFGVLLGGILALLSLWWLYRAKFVNVAQILLPLGLGLILLGIFTPRTLTHPYKVWMKFARLLSFVSTPIILAIVYFLVLTPTGLVKKAVGWDPLRRRSARQPSYWRSYSSRQRDPRHFEKMY